MVIHSVPSIVDNVGETVCNWLIGMHAFSGCDSTSRFAGLGKRTVWKSLIEDDDFCHAIKSLGENVLPDSAMLEQAEKVQMYKYQ